MQFKKEWVLPVSVGFGSFGIGVGVGCLITLIRNKKLEDIKSEVVESRSENVQLQFKFEEHEEKLGSLIQQASHVVREFNDYGHAYLNRANSEDLTLSVNKHPSKKKDIAVIIPTGTEDDSDLVNIFRREEDEGWDYDEEVKDRGPDHPYIIHRDEYHANEPDYSQTTISYYPGDNVLCDELDVPIYNPEKLVGRLEFGHGSGDPNVCFVRNEKIECDYEVLREEGSFLVEVLGADAEDDLNAGDLKHSVQKFRPE